MEPRRHLQVAQQGLRNPEAIRQLSRQRGDADAPVQGAGNTDLGQPGQECEELLEALSELLFESSALASLGGQARGHAAHLEEAANAAEQMRRAQRANQHVVAGLRKRSLTRVSSFLLTDQRPELGGAAIPPGTYGAREL